MSTCSRLPRAAHGQSPGDFGRPRPRRLAEPFVAGGVQASRRAPARASGPASAGRSRPTSGVMQSAIPPTARPTTGTPKRRNSSVEIPSASTRERRHPKWDARTILDEARERTLLVHEAHRLQEWMRREFPAGADGDHAHRLPLGLDPLGGREQQGQPLPSPVLADEA